MLERVFACLTAQSDIKISILYSAIAKYKNQLHTEVPNCTVTKSYNSDSTFIAGDTKNVDVWRNPNCLQIVYYLLKYICQSKSGNSIQSSLSAGQCK